MATIAHSAPKINWDDLSQIPALPLGSWLKTDPWDDHVHQLNAKLYAPLNPRDKMPLEVTPVYYRLQRYDEAQSQAANAAAAAQAKQRARQHSPRQAIRLPAHPAPRRRVEHSHRPELTSLCLRRRRAPSRSKQTPNPQQ